MGLTSFCWILVSLGLSTSCLSIRYRWSCNQWRCSGCLFTLADTFDLAFGAFPLDLVRAAAVCGGWGRGGCCWSWVGCLHLLLLHFYCSSLEITAALGANYNSGLISRWGKLVRCCDKLGLFIYCSLLVLVGSSFGSCGWSCRAPCFSF